MKHRKPDYQRAMKLCGTSTETFGERRYQRTVVPFPCDYPKGAPHQGHCRLPADHPGEHETGLTCADIH